MKPVVGLAFVAVLALTGCSSTSSAPKRPPLPDTVLQAFGQGKPLDVGKLRGPAVINFWAGDCHPCRREMPLYQSFARQSHGKVAVIGIDYAEDGGSQAEALVKATGVTYPLYVDPDRTLPSHLLPQLMLVDAQGRIVHRQYVEITSVKQLDRLVEKHLKVAS